MELIIREYLIDTPIIEILEKCKQELNNGKLSRIEDKGTWVSVPCPIHSGGLEKHNSCGIISDPDSDKEYGFWHCFTCGEKGNLATFIAECFEVSLRDGEDWLISNFGKPITERRYNLSPIILKRNDEPIKGLNESSLDTLQRYHPYMQERKLNQYVIDKFKIRYNPNTKSIVFPVWDENGNYLFNTERSIVEKKFFIPPNVQKPVYLLNYILTEEIDCVVVCESQINALTLWAHKIPAIALFGTGTDYQYDLLNNSCIRHYYLAFDGDEAGDKAIKRFRKKIRKDVFVDDIILPRGEDVNSLREEKFNELFSKLLENNI